MAKVNPINVVKAIKRQIPKKPINVKISGGVISSADCPECGYCFPDIGGIWESYGEVDQHNYCSECGQKIDWQEVVI